MFAPRKKVTRKRLLNAHFLEVVFVGDDGQTQYVLTCLKASPRFAIAEALYDQYVMVIDQQRPGHISMAHGLVLEGIALALLLNYHSTVVAYNPVIISFWWSSVLRAWLGPNAIASLKQFGYTIAACQYM